jgi:hypothetical protein
LTTALEKAGNKTVVYDGKPIAGKRLLARILWHGLLTGVIDFPDGSQLHLGPTDWKDIVKFIYGQIDGAPPQQLQHTGADGGPLSHLVEIVPIDYRIAASPLAPRPVGDSEASGEDKDSGDGSPLG